MPSRQPLLLLLLLLLLGLALQLSAAVTLDETCSESNSEARFDTTALECVICAAGEVAPDCSCAPGFFRTTTVDNAGIVTGTPCLECTAENSAVASTGDACLLCGSTTLGLNPAPAAAADGSAGVADCLCPEGEVLVDFDDETGTAESEKRCEPCAEGYWVDRDVSPYQCKTCPDPDMVREVRLSGRKWAMDDLY